MSEEVGFFEAYDAVLTPLFGASNALHLVAGAHAMGLMVALRTPSSVERLAAMTGADQSRVATVCTALTAIDVAEQGADGYTLTPAWKALTDPGCYVPLDTAITGNAVEGRLLTAAAGTTYWSMSSADRLAYARAVSPNPYSDELVAAFRAQLESDPDRAPMLSGGRLLELGCGVAGRVLTTLRAAPELTAVGVELSDDLAAEAQRRADELDLTDRFTVVCGDAADFTDPTPFDYGFWSQFFFPESARAGALATLMNQLRSGASALAPLGVDHEALAADPKGAAARDYALWRVVLDSWGVPERTPVSLTDEFTAAGFIDVAVINREGAGSVVRVTRP